MTNRTDISAHLATLAAAGELDPRRRPPAAWVRREIIPEYRARYGFAPQPAPILTAPTGQAKLAKTARPVWSLTLAPYTASGAGNVCPWAGACTAPCVLGKNAGLAQAYGDTIMGARGWRTALVAEEPAAAIAVIADEIHRGVRNMHKTAGYRRRAGLRLNAGSDLLWELIAPDLLTVPYVDPYDYTKWPADLRPAPDGRYRLIRSADENDTGATLEAKLSEGPTALVLAGFGRSGPLPETIGGFRVVDGDRDDFQNAQEPAGTIIGLRLKGSPRTQRAAVRSGFARTAEQWAHALEGTRRLIPVAVLP